MIAAVFSLLSKKTCSIAVLLSDKQPYKEDVKMLAEDLHYFYFFLRMLTS